MQQIFKMLGLLGLIVANSIAGNLLHGVKLEQNDILSNKRAIIVYRENDSSTKRSAVIFLNNNIVASLLPNEYTFAKICTGDIKLRVATRVDVIYANKSQIVQVQRDKITYIKIVEMQNKTFAPFIVDDIEGQKALKNITTTSNIINRYIPRITVGADNLFAFGSAKLSPSSQTAIDELSEDIKTCSSKIGSIEIVGHADRLGNGVFNEKLSKKRAQAVADHLTKSGIKTPIVIDGRGAKEPITTNCAGKFSPALVQCLQPDRRTVIKLLDANQTTMPK